MRTLISALAICLTTTAPAIAASCGNTGSGFDAWKSEFAADAKRAGVGQRGLQTLASASYSQKTINADRNQRRQIRLQRFRAYPPWIAGWLCLDRQKADEPQQGVL